MQNGKKTAAQQNTAVISLGELERIKDTCALINRGEQDNQGKTDKRKTLYQLSQTRCKNWPNTIEALRKKKDDDRIRKLEEEEIERRKQGISYSILKFTNS